MCIIYLDCCFAIKPVISIWCLDEDVSIEVSNVCVDLHAVNLCVSDEDKLELFVLFSETLKYYILKQILGIQNINNGLKWILKMAHYSKNIHTDRVLLCMYVESSHRSNQFDFAVYWSNQCNKFLKKQFRKKSL